MAELLNIGTLGEMNASVCRWARERIDTDTVNDAINDAIQSLWKSVSLATLSRFLSPQVDLQIPSGATVVPVFSIPDPTAYLQVGVTPGGALPLRTKSFTFAYCTDSGSQTAASLSVVAIAQPGYLFAVLAPVPVPEAIGWNLYAGDAGRLAIQNVEPLPFGASWVEPPFGVKPSPNGPFPPHENTTGDNITAIARLDIRNGNGTLTPQNQADISSALFTAGQRRLSSTSPYVQHAYDLVNNNRIEIRPSPQTTIDATLFYIVKPRRLRYPISRIPFSSFDGTQFLRQKALADVMFSLGEMEMAGAWDGKAEKERERCVLSVLNENWHKNKQVKRYM